MYYHFLKTTYLISKNSTALNLIIIVIFSFFTLQKLKRRLSALETIDWTPEKKAKMTPVLTTEYTSEEELDDSQQERRRTVIPLQWESAELALCKRQLDAHDHATYRRSPRGHRYQVVRDQANRLSTSPKPANAPAWTVSV